MMKEWNREELASFIAKKSSGLVYFYTPLCGTCQVASRMLRVIKEIVDVEMGKMNINFYPDLAMLHAVESVPCLLFIKDGQVLEIMYAFHSVPNLFDKIKNHFH